MRSAVLVTAVGLSLGACLVGDAGAPGQTGDDDTGGDPGPGSSMDPGTNTPTPKLAVSVDKATMSTELMSSNLITVTARGSDGFSGPVTLDASVVDGTGAAMPAWTVTWSSATIDVPVDGMATSVATLTIPSDSQGLAGTVKINASSSLGKQAGVASAAITAANQITFEMKLTGNKCTYPSGTRNIKVGTKVRWLNMETKANITIHMDRNERDGLVHQDDPGTAPGEAYERTAALNDDGQLSDSPMPWYCHAPGPDMGGNNPKLLVVP